MLRFAEHEVVLPVVVITELEAKRHHPELGYFARPALRMLDDLRVQHGRLDAPLPIGDDGGTLRVELNHTDPSACRPASGSATTTPGSSRSPATSPTRAATSRWSSKDLPMRVKASRGRPRRRGVPRRAGRRLRLDRHGRARRDGGRGRRAVRRRARSTCRRRPSCPATPALVLLSARGSGARPRHRRQAGAAGPRRPGRVRPARPQRRAADRAGHAAGPGRRHRLASAAAPAPASPRWPCAPGWRP